MLQSMNESSILHSEENQIKNPETENSLYIPPKTPPSHVLLQALSSLAPSNISKWDESCSHLHGYYKNISGSIIFPNNYKLSKLQTISAFRIFTYNNNKSLSSEKKLLQKAECYGKPLDLYEVIQSCHPSMCLAAEFKRASPSKGNINVHATLEQQVLSYVQGGANILSILTEPYYFKGSLQDLTRVRFLVSKSTLTKRPLILRKDFITSTYMIAESLANGADTILLIVSILPYELLNYLINYARNICHMEPLVEIHTVQELYIARKANARVIGVNNRNLHDFTVNLELTVDIARVLQCDNLCFEHGLKSKYVLCALSGINNAEDVEKYRSCGIGMVLIGESLMKSRNIRTFIKNLKLDPSEFLKYTQRIEAENNLDNKKSTIIKICGVTNLQDARLVCESGVDLVGIIFAEKSLRRVDNLKLAKKIIDVVQEYGERKSRILFNMDLGLPPSGDIIAVLSYRAKLVQEISKRHPLTVGVFQNQSEEYIRHVSEIIDLDMIQLHGKEGMKASDFGKYNRPVIRVVDIKSKLDHDKTHQRKLIIDNIISNMTKDPMIILLDTSGGGSGKVFDWNIARELQENHGFVMMMGGGLTPENICELMRNVDPWGIDVSSGIESKEGKKDTGKLNEFVMNVRKSMNSVNLLDV